VKNREFGRRYAWRVMVIGIGIDLVDVDTFKADFENHPTALSRTFSKAELDYCFSTASPFQSLSSRFAAKEAFMKAIGTGSTDEVHFHEITVEHDSAGRPSICLQGGAEEVYRTLGRPKIQLSMSHLKSIACAVVVLDRE
jgi:holo-[acyl-carrier protein] synthase